MRSISAIEVKPCAHLLHAVLAQPHHPRLLGGGGDLIDRAVLEHQRPDALVHAHHLVHAHAPAIAAGAAARAPDRLVRLRARRGRARRAPPRTAAGGACSACTASARAAARRCSRSPRTPGTARCPCPSTGPARSARRGCAASRAPRWPVSAASTAMCAVSRSRISPTMITSGSARSIERRPTSNVTPALGAICICLTPAIRCSTGSSIVRIERSPSFSTLSAPYSVVDLPEPVGPVTSTAPLGFAIARSKRLQRRRAPSPATPGSGPSRPCRGCATPRSRRTPAAASPP